MPAGILLPYKGKLVGLIIRGYGDGQWFIIIKEYGDTFEAQRIVQESPTSARLDAVEEGKLIHDNYREVVNLETFKHENPDGWIKFMEAHTLIASFMEK